jgi:uncharacterized membrane protein
MGKLGRFITHRLWDEADARRALPRDALARLAGHIATSEQTHHGQIRICVEASLPLRHLRQHATARQRAVLLFGKLGVWDTEHNNGVLIYLLLADRAIEVVADRGLHASADEWQALVAQLSTALKAGRFEQGLHEAVDAVGALLQREFPRQAGEPGNDELPNDVVVL